eukprot:GILI01018757.1.p2 GENE.GILI01018757.1~~GILI01018757.1.p2  ORF type:complete len:200 (+),score=45.39 GILI01018757.1:74-673(+)
MVFQKVVVVDCRGHLLGRLASVIAKELLSGQRVVCVRAEEVNISGSFFRNKLRFLAFLRKRTNTNPKRGPIHYRAPSRILWRVIRGMLPHKTNRGALALERLKVFEGMPHPYDKVKRAVVPAALRVLRLNPSRKYTRLGDLSSEMGWKHDELVTRLENKRKIRSAAWYARVKALNKLKSKALANVSDKVAELGLSQYGH